MKATQRSSKRAHQCLACWWFSAFVCCVALFCLGSSNRMAWVLLNASAVIRCHWAVGVNEWCSVFWILRTSVAWNVYSRSFSRQASAREVSPSVHLRFPSLLTSLNMIQTVSISSKGLFWSKIVQFCWWDFLVMYNYPKCFKFCKKYMTLILLKAVFKIIHLNKMMLDNKYTLRVIATASSIFTFII